MEASQLKLRSSQLSLQKLAERVNTGVSALLLNVHQPRCVLFLLLGRLKLAGDRVEFDVGR